MEHYLIFYRMIPKTVYCLYVGGFNEPFDRIRKGGKHLKELNNKIIECTWDATKNDWVFMRERTDKSFPNAYTTAQGKHFKYTTGCVKNLGQFEKLLKLKQSNNNMAFKIFSRKHGLRLSLAIGNVAFQDFNFQFL